MSDLLNELWILTYSDEGTLFGTAGVSTDKWSTRIRTLLSKYYRAN